MSTLVYERNVYLIIFDLEFLLFYEIRDIDERIWYNQGNCAAVWREDIIAGNAFALPQILEGILEERIY